MEEERGHVVIEVEIVAVHEGGDEEPLQVWDARPEKKRREFGEVEGWGAG